MNIGNPVKAVKDNIIRKSTRSVLINNLEYGYWNLISNETFSKVIDVVDIIIQRKYE